MAAALGDRDRLAAFLDDARVARSVIGAEPLAAEPAVPGPWSVGRGAWSEPVTVSAPDLRGDATLAAEQIRRRLADPVPASGTVVSSLRAPRGMAAGWVIAIRLVADTTDGDVAAERLILVHATGAPRRPTSAAEARRSAAEAIESVRPRLGDAVPDLASWRAAMERAHDRSVDAQILREAALRDRRVDHTPVQPGLFDRRALVAAERRDERARAAWTEHADRIGRLEARRRLRMAAIPAAVLILWR